ncbi:alpha/beta hydrolase [Lichenihabitans psoromatis]|uniref:alpha/beta hydrolase n=1 Tax=Lichenihabitans psoromatis TaxID=2528642 RepID=UPI0010384A19|nr:alpha/beta hydrolase [Lichenihabitans psoromatis]
MTNTSIAPSSVDLDILLGPDAKRSPDMQAVWDWLIEQDGTMPNWLDMSPAEARQQQDRAYARWNSELPVMASVEMVTLAGSPAVQAELLVPKGAIPGCILFFHGGGWAFGGLQSHARFMRLLAEATQTRVLGVDYRLAPEHPYPAPLEDCVSAWRAIVANRNDPGFDGPLAVAGDSAGANLALAVILSEIDADRRKPDLGLLFYGAYDNDFESPSYTRFAEGFGLTRSGMQRFWEWYVPPGSTARDNPLVWPAEASEPDLARLPPVFLNAAGLDPLLCDTVALAKRIEAAGVPHRLAIHDGVHHGFMQMSLRLPEARNAIRQAAVFFTETVG